jgi:dolichol kinase
MMGMGAPRQGAAGPVERAEGYGLRQEVIRKTIHVATLLVPLVVWFLPRPLGLLVLGGGVVLAVLIEWARSEFRWARYLFLSRTRRLLRVRERTGLAGATYMAVGYFLAYLLFPRPIAVLAMLYNALGDAAAALVGRRWGSRRTTWGKSWEGFGAGATVNLFAGLMVPGIPPLAAAAGALGAATLEFLPIPLDDNLRVTLGGGLLVWAFVLASGAPV